ncbi:Histone-lysine N-methyltransferase, H3 lysine-9 specific SUVH3 [Linum grandiflorum]
MFHTPPPIPARFIAWALLQMGSSRGLDQVTTASNQNQPAEPLLCGTEAIRIGAPPDQGVTTVSDPHDQFNDFSHDINSLPVKAKEIVQLPSPSGIPKGPRSDHYGRPTPSVLSPRRENMIKKKRRIFPIFAPRKINDKNMSVVVNDDSFPVTDHLSPSRENMVRKKRLVSLSSVLKKIDDQKLPIVKGDGYRAANYASPRTPRGDNLVRKKRQFFPIFAPRKINDKNMSIVVKDANYPATNNVTRRFLGGEKMARKIQPVSPISDFGKINDKNMSTIVHGDSYRATNNVSPRFSRGENMVRKIPPVSPISVPKKINNENMSIVANDNSFHKVNHVSLRFSRGENIVRKIKSGSPIFVPRKINNENISTVVNDDSSRAADYVLPPRFAVEPEEHDRARMKVNDVRQLFNEMVVSFKDSFCLENERKKNPFVAAANELKSMGRWVNKEPRLGQISGIEIGDTFGSRAEMVVIGLHHDFFKGIDKINDNGNSLATCVVATGRYLDNEMGLKDSLLYSGEGGNPIVSNGVGDVRDQKLEGGNYALWNSMMNKIPVRVIRKKGVLAQDRIAMEANGHADAAVNPNPQVPPPLPILPGDLVNLPLPQQLQVDAPAVAAVVGEQANDSANEQHALAFGAKHPLKNDVWPHFTRFVDKNGVMKSKCKYCHKILGGDTSNGTSHLRNHKKVCVQKQIHDGSQKNLGVNFLSNGAVGKKEL